MGGWVNGWVDVLALQPHSPRSMDNLHSACVSHAAMIAIGVSYKSLNDENEPPQVPGKVFDC